MRHGGIVTGFAFRINTFVYFYDKFYCKWMPGKPVFKGRRLTVEHALNERGTAMCENDLLRRDMYDLLRAAMLYVSLAVRLDV